MSPVKWNVPYVPVYPVNQAPDGRVFLRGEEVHRLAIYTPTKQLPLEVAEALVEAVSLLRTIFIEVREERVYGSPIHRPPYVGWQIKVLEPGLPDMVEKVFPDDDGFAEALDRLGLVRAER